MNEVGDTDSDCKAALFWKEAVGSDANVVINLTGTRAMVAFVARISGANTSSPIHQQLFPNPDAAATNPRPIPGVTTTIENCLALYGLAAHQGTTFSVSGAGWSENADDSSEFNNTGGCFGSKEMAAAGATGTASVTMAAARRCSVFQVAIAPTE